VDKHEKGQTITIKINGKERPFKEDQSKDKRKTGYNNGFDMDENVARYETAAAEETLDESFDWILPELNDEPVVKENKIADQPKKNKNKGWIGSTNRKNNASRGIFASVFFAILLAIVIGVSFGLILLKLVITDYAAEEITEPRPTVNQEKPSGGTASVNVPPISAFIVQGGVFSTNQSAEEVKTAVEQKGAPAQIVNMNGKFFLYLSVADSIENAKEIGNELKKNDLETFAKPLDFGGKEISGLQDTERKLLESAPALYETLAQAASEAALAHSISKDTAENIVKQGDLILQTEETKIKNENIKLAISNLANAVEKANAFQKSPEPETAKELQNELLSFLAAYQSL
jgi:stage II sporulation protein B